MNTVARFGPGAGSPLVHVVFPRHELRWSSDGTLRRPRSGPFPRRALVLMVLGALARRHGWRVRVVDETRQPLPRESPDLVLLTTWTYNAPSAYELPGGTGSAGCRS